VGSRAGAMCVLVKAASEACVNRIAGSDASGPEGYCGIRLTVMSWVSDSFGGYSAARFLGL
jgi:hypothetical protein